jgi:hypothetical protein
MWRGKPGKEVWRSFPCSRPFTVLESTYIMSSGGHKNLLGLQRVENIVPAIFCYPPLEGRRSVVLLLCSATFPSRSGYHPIVEALRRSKKLFK